MSSHQIQSPVWSLQKGCSTLVPFWNCGYASSWGDACGEGEDDEEAWFGRAGGSSWADAGWVGKHGAAAGGSEAAALPSFLVCWGLGAGAPLFLRVRLGGTGGGGTGGGLAWKKRCIACWPGSRSGGSAGVCMVAFTRFQLRSASFCTVSEGSVGHGSAGGLSSKGWWR